MDEPLQIEELVIRGNRAQWRYVNADGTRSVPFMMDIDAPGIPPQVRQAIDAYLAKGEESNGEEEAGDV